MLFLVNDVNNDDGFFQMLERSERRTTQGDILNRRKAMQRRHQIQTSRDFGLVFLTFVIMNAKSLQNASLSEISK